MQVRVGTVAAFAFRADLVDAPGHPIHRIRDLQQRRVRAGKLSERGNSRKVAHAILRD